MMAQIRRNVIYSVYQVSLALSAIVCLLLVH
jgi:hypothetical protein